MPPTSLRLPSDVEEGLAAWCDRVGASRSAVITMALREWLAAQRHPGVVVRRALDGDRRPALEGGPEIWSVVDTWRSTPVGERSVEAVAEFLGLRRDQVETALGWWAEHREETDAWLERHHRLQEEELAAWERRQALATA